MPSWASIYKKHVAEGFEIVGLESQGSSEAEISEVVKAKDAAFDMVCGGDLRGAVVAGIPHSFLFGADGNLISDKLRAGPELETSVAKAVKECGMAMAGPGPYTKLAPLAAQIKSGFALGTVLKTLALKKASKDATEAAEATMMFTALQTSGDDQVASAVEIKSDDPLAAVAKLDRLAAQFAGDDIGKKAASEAAAMRKDPAIKKEAEGEAMWKVIISMNEKLKPVKNLRDPKDEAFRKLNLPAIQSMLLGCQTIGQRCPGTKAADRAKALMDEYH